MRLIEPIPVGRVMLMTDVGVHQLQHELIMEQQYLLWMRLWQLWMLPVDVMQHQAQD